MLNLRVVSRPEYQGDLVEFTKSGENFLIAFVVGSWFTCDRATYRLEAEAAYAKTK